MVRIGARSLVVLALAVSGCAGRAQAPKTCEGLAAARVEQVWSDEAKAAVRAGSVGADPSDGAALAERFVTGLDALASAWVASQQRTCEADAASARIDACMQANLAEQQALISLASEGELVTLRVLEYHIGHLARAMQSCQNPAVYAWYEVDDEAAATARTALAEAEVYRTAGDERIHAALAQAESAASASESVGLKVDLWVAQAKLDSASGELERAKLRADRALALAEQEGYELGAANAAMIGGYVHALSGDPEAVLSRYRKALDIRLRLLGKEHIDTAVAYAEVGGALYSVGEYEAALEHERMGVAIAEQLLGPAHPSTATYYANLGQFYIQLGLLDDALEYQRKALASIERVYGSDHTHTAICHENIGLVYLAKGEYDRALRYFRAALAIHKRVRESGNTNLISVYANIATIYASKGEYGQTLEYLRKALALAERELGPEHPQTRMTREDLGQLCTVYEPACALAR